jgi:hypothetical protein
VVGHVGWQGGLTFFILSALVRLASRLIACNFKCNPWCENKVLVPLLFLIGGFHFSHLF